MLNVIIESLVLGLAGFMIGCGYQMKKHEQIQDDSSEEIERMRQVFADNLGIDVEHTRIERHVAVGLTEEGYRKALENPHLRVKEESPEGATTYEPDSYRQTSFDA